MPHTVLRVLLWGGICAVASTVSRAELVSQEIRNSSAATPANDLRLEFTGDVGTIQIRDSANRTDEEDVFQNLIIRGVGYWGYYFPAGNVGMRGGLPSVIPAGGTLRVRYDNRNGTLDRTQSYWTDDGARILTAGGGNALASLGAPPTIDVIGGTAVAIFTDPDPSTPIVYTGIQLYVNNNLADYTLDQFDSPTGQPVTSGIPPELLVSYGNPQQLSFGPVLPGTYVLALANAAATSDPSTTYSMAAADPVPEPSTFSFLCAGCIAMLVLGRRRSLTAP
jgi:hypothetical protein